MKNWYEENIEEPVRDLVKLLRDNGINTECSCGHQMYVQFQVIDDEMNRVDYILFDNGYRDYIIETSITRDDGHKHSTGTVYFKKDNKYPYQIEKQAALEAYYSRLA
jgi:hypothetical protein